MLPVDANKLALKLMGEFGLLPRWGFEFDDAVTRFGCCHRNRTSWRGQMQDRVGKITLSRPMTIANSPEQVEDTIRHEIAHALCPARMRGDRQPAHGTEWKAMCAKTGANPERVCGADVVLVEGDWSATCPSCAKVYYKHKRPSGDYYFCPSKECNRSLLPYIPGADSGRRHPLRKLTFRHKDALPESKPTRAAIEAMKARLRGDSK